MSITSYHTEPGSDRAKHGKISQLLSNSAALALVPMVARLAGFALVILVARGYGEHDLGIYRFSMALVWYFLEFARLGISPLLVRDMAARPVDAGNVWWSGLLLRSGAAGLGWVILAIMAIILKYDIATCQMIALFSVAMLFVLLCDTNNQAFIATGKAGWNLLTEAAGSISFVVLGVVALYLNGGIVGIAIAKLLSVTLQAAIGWWLVARYLFPIQPHASSKIVSTMLAQSWPFAMIAVTATLISEGDVFILRQSRGFEIVGLYVAAQTLVGVIKSGLAGLGLAVSPLLAEAFASSDLSRMAAMSRVSLRLAAWANGAAIAALAALAEPLMFAMYGGPFGESASVLRVVVWVLPSYAICNILGFGIVATGGERVMVKINMLVTLTNIGLNLLLIPLDALIGAGGAAVLSYLLCLMLYTHEARNRRICPLDLGRLHLRPLLASAGMYLMLRTGIGMAGENISLTLVAVLAAAGVALYGIFLWLLGDLDKETLAGLRQTVVRHH